MVMRILAIIFAVLLVSIPVMTRAKACEAGQSAAKAATTTFSADEMKPPKKKMAKKTAKKKEKVEYMRAAPMK
jgi:hypothetical protein